MTGRIVVYVAGGVLQDAYLDESGPAGLVVIDGDTETGGDEAVGVSVFADPANARDTFYVREMPLKDFEHYQFRRVLGAARKAGRIR